MKTTTQHISNSALRTKGAAMAGGLEYLGQVSADYSTVGSTFGEHTVFANRSRPVSSPWCDRLIPGHHASLLG
ncbi:hypothetical protein OT109_10230 [Phycisphaeraceae bacterium D3-23]